MELDSCCALLESLVPGSRSTRRSLALEVLSISFGPRVEKQYVTCNSGVSLYCVIIIILFHILKRKSWYYSRKSVGLLSVSLWTLVFSYVFRGSNNGEESFLLSEPNRSNIQ